jgi:hypothetical protein
MRLFHQLEQDDQNNSAHYCMHIVIEDLLEDGVQLEPFSEEDTRMHDVLVKAVEEAHELAEDQQFHFLVSHKEAGPIIFDIAIDMARSAYYHPDEDLVIHYESLRTGHGHEHDDGEDDDSIETVEDLVGAPKKGDHNLN